MFLEILDLIKGITKEKQNKVDNIFNSDFIKSLIKTGKR